MADKNDLFGMPEPGKKMTYSPYLPGARNRYQTTPASLRVPPSSPSFTGLEPGGTSPTVTVAGGGVKQSLDNVLTGYTSAQDTWNAITKNPALTQTQSTLPDNSALEQFLASQTYMTGGPNQATLAQLAAQRAAAQRNYKTNRADAQNLYGTLSMDESAPSTGLIGEIETLGKQLQSGYTGAISESAARSQAQQTGLSEEQKRQQANRERAAAELGLAPESIQTNYASDEALNKGMSDVAATSTSWENLLRSQQGSAMENTNRLITATGNTRNQTILGMKAYLDAQEAQIQAQIAAEKAKTPTQKLTALGKLLESRMNEQIVNEMFPSELGQTPRAEAESQAMIDLGLDPKNPAHKTQFRQLQQSGSAKLSNKNLGAAPLSTPEQIAVDALGIPLAYFNPDYGLYGAGK